MKKKERREGSGIKVDFNKRTDLEHTKIHAHEVKIKIDLREKNIEDTDVQTDYRMSSRVSHNDHFLQSWVGSGQRAERPGRLTLISPGLNLNLTSQSSTLAERVM